MRVTTRRAVRTPTPDTPAEPLPQLPRGGGVERAQVLAPDGRRQLGELGRECRAQALAQQVVGGGDRLRDGRRGGRRGEQGRAGPVRSPRRVPPGGPPCARSALRSERRGDSRGMPDHCRRSCSAATKWYRSSMSAKWWNTSRNDTPARAATALAVGSGSPARRRATSASATLRRVRRPRARRPSVASSPASAATSRSTRSSSCLRGSGSARSRPPKPRSPAPPAASEEPGVTDHTFLSVWESNARWKLAHRLHNEPVRGTHDGAAASSRRGPQDERSVHRPWSRASAGRPEPPTPGPDPLHGERPGRGHCSCVSCAAAAPALPAAAGTGSAGPRGRPTRARPGPLRGRS